ncbi:sugar ABC transporter ATP-binding protein [Pelagibacterium lentulum]|uniref:Ribonucleotide-diphosphate reductase subunit alpha n=1 Tax=Pelagibacterium lentulum TaxID=2029865 RepID=A0A916R774_9HYPH|nr:sugar ABC transporter ATP-binding protein [Pelagibacterium lentulum]GGA38884.1 ribonucleotide-diphosphate reductase subunit alpha [Pelagibacterium lentulum]
MDPILTIKDIEKSFIGVKVLHGVDLDVRAGEVHALLGENGAGKSTLMKILCGIHSPDTGTITIAGQERAFRHYDDAVAAGVGIVFQEFSLVPYLNAVENIFLGRELRNKFGLLDKRAMSARAIALLDRLGVQMDLEVPIGHLSVAQQQFIEIAKALSLEARILVLDEPTATLTPNEVEHLFEVMRQLREQGVAMVFISHHLDEIFEICDRISVLRDGHFVGTRAVVETDIDQLVEMMVGRRIEANFPPKPEKPPKSEVVLELEDFRLARDHAPGGFRLHKGEILGFAGLVGSGRTETALAMLGAHKCASRKVTVNGIDRNFREPADALACGVGLLPESRKTEGLVTAFSVKHNISLNNYGKYRQAGVLIDGPRETQSTLDVMGRVSVKAQGPDTPVETLSGGNQQKVVIGRWINHHANILIFDEPTRGIDVGAKAEIYHLMRELTEKGYAIIMISSELPEIIGMCDRVCVFKGGRIVRELEGDAITPENVMKHATAGESHALAG